MSLTQEQQDALELISEDGAVGQLTRFESEYDPVEGEQTITSVTTVDIALITFPVNKESLSSFDDSLIEDFKRGKARFFYVAAVNPTTETVLPFDPQAGDIITFNNELWDVAGASPLSPAGDDILFYVGCRKSARESLPTSFY